MEEENKKIEKLEFDRNSWVIDFNKIEFEEYFNQFNIIKDNEKDISNSKIYVYSKIVPQDKLRESGFSIKRDKDEADYILIENPYNNSKLNTYYEDRYRIFRTYGSHGTLLDLIDFLYENKDKKFVYSDVVYGNIVGEKATKETYNQLSELLSSYNTSNTILAMEMMTNFDWSDNEIYLFDLYSKYRNNIYDSSFFKSINFQSFIKTNNCWEDGGQYNIDRPSYYIKYCKNNEHFEFVDNKFKKVLYDRLKHDAKSFSYNINSLEIELVPDIS